MSLSDLASLSKVMQLPDGSVEYGQPCTRCLPHNLTIAQRKVRVDRYKEVLEKYNRGASKVVYKIVTGEES